MAEKRETEIQVKEPYSMVGMNPGEAMLVRRIFYSAMLALLALPV
jgi:hypothetical protein